MTTTDSQRRSPTPWVLPLGVARAAMGRTTDQGDRLSPMTVPSPAQPDDVSRTPAAQPDDVSRTPAAPRGAAALDRSVTAPALPGSVGRWLRRHPTLADAGLAAVVMTLNIPLGLCYMAYDGFPDAPALAAVTVAAWLVCGGALALRRRWPVAAWLITLLVPALHEATGALVFHTSPEQSSYVSSTLSVVILLGLPIMLGTLAVRLRPAATWVAWLVSTALPGGTQVYFENYTGAQVGTAFLVVALINAIGVLVGLNARSLRLRLVELEARSSRMVLAREQGALLAAATERSRIAREMHDVVAHSLAVMITMADGAAATIDRDPATAKQALEMLAETGRSALADTRRLVGVLREDPGATSDPRVREASTSQAQAGPPPSAQAQDAPSDTTEAAGRPGQRSGLVRRSPSVRELPVPEFAPPGTVVPVEPSAEIAALRERATTDVADASAGGVPLAPAPESSDLEALVARFRGAGMPTTLTCTGDALPEDKGLQLTVYRIAQEALTNILRYAPTTPAIEVSLGRHRGTAVLTVDNEAAPGSRPMHGSGKGLIGMRERAAVYGGTVQAGPTATGWRVRAVLRWDENDDDQGGAQWQKPA